jgi:hypothetical protein
MEEVKLSDREGPSIEARGFSGGKVLPDNGGGWFVEGDTGISVKVGQVVRMFSVKQLIFMVRAAGAESVEDMEGIIGEMGLSGKTVGRWLGEAGVKAFIADRRRNKVLKLVRDEDWWYARMTDIFEDGQVSMKNRIEAGKEAGMRVSPKVEKVQHEFEDVDFVFTAKRSER